MILKPRFWICKFYHKCEDFDYGIVNFPLLDGDVPRSTSYGVYISQLILFSRASSHTLAINFNSESS